MKDRVQTPQLPRPTTVRVATLSESDLVVLLELAAQRGAERALAAMADQREDWLSLRDASALLGISMSTLRKRALDGSIKGYRIGKLWRFRRSSL